MKMVHVGLVDGYYYWSKHNIWGEFGRLNSYADKAYYGYMTLNEAIKDYPNIKEY